MHAYSRTRTLLLATVAAFILIPATQAAALTVKLAGVGTGKVTGGTLFFKGQINCSNIPTEVLTECSHTEGIVAHVTLTETPGPESAFAGWAGIAACEGSTSTTCASDPGEGTITATFVKQLPPPTVTIETPSGVGPGEATFHGTVDPNGNDAKWRFEYRPVGSASWSDAPVPDGDAGAGTTAVRVQATANTLEPNVEYEVRLQASNSTTSETSGVQSFRTPALPPTVGVGKAWSLTEASATLVATVDPNNARVSECRFEYGLTTAYGHTAPCSPAEPGSRDAPVQVLADVEGLAPSSTYHFRLVAANECASGCGTAEGQDATFATRATVTLPQRHYELVSPANTDGVFASPFQASPDGEHYVYNTILPAPGAQSGFAPFFRATRHADGAWTVQDIAGPRPPLGAELDPRVNPVLSSDSLAVAVYSYPYGLVQDDQNGVADIYREDVAAGEESLTWLSRDPLIEGPQTEGSTADISNMVYVSPDGKVVLFESKRRLLPEVDLAEKGAYTLYQWKEGNVSVVGVEPSGSTGFATGSHLGSYHANAEGHEEIEGAVARDGARVFFESPDAAGNERLYVRIDGEKTVEASASAAGAPAIAEPLNVSYWGSGEEGEVVFFTSSSPLTKDSGAPNTDNSPGLYGCNTNVCDLYAYHVGSEQLEDLTPASGGGGVRRVYAVSEDGRRVYFTSTDRLNEAGQLTTTGAASESLQGVAGEANLYLAELPSGEAGSEVKLSFVATIDPEEDNVLVENGRSIGVNKTQGEREVATSPSGSVLAFRDRLAQVPGRQTAGLPQMYVYEAQRHELSCASCPGDGSAPTSGASMTIRQVELYPYSSHRRNVTSQGAVFFTSANALVPGDTDGVEDLYEFREGQIKLISTGQEPSSAEWGDASRDGSIVFFGSTAALAGGAQEGIRHIYAARVGPAPPTPPTPAAPCGGGECHGALTAPAAPQSIGSAIFSGAGNFTPRASAVTKHNRTCAKGKRRRRGQCVPVKRLLRHALQKCAREHRHSRHKTRRCKRRVRARLRHRRAHGARRERHRGARRRGHRSRRTAHKNRGGQK